jgi:hypothetical protein
LLPLPVSDNVVEDLGRLVLLKHVTYCYTNFSTGTY